jgi:ATP-dependent helicase/nuclease subunit B
VSERRRSRRPTPRMPSSVRLITGPRADLERSLAASVRQAQAGAPLRPVHVLVGGTLMRPYLRRRLAEELGGVVGVHLLTPGELGLMLGERRLVDEGKRPLPFLAERVLASQAARDTPGAFEPVAELPGFPGLLARTLRDLRVAGVSSDALARAADAEDPDDPDTQRLASLAELHATVTRLRTGRYGSEDALAAADPTLLGPAGLIVYGVWETNALLRGALRSIAQHGPLTFLLPRSDTTADGILARTIAFANELGAQAEQPAPADARTDLEVVQRDLFAPAAGERPAGDGSVAMVCAPDPTREVRRTIRQCLRWADEGIAFHEMAIAYADGGTYRPLVEAALREASVPSYAHEGTPLSERPLGRRIHALLDLAEARDAAGRLRLERATVVTFLADARLPNDTYERYGKPSVPRWEGITRRAGVVAGLEGWNARLGSYGDELAADPEAPDWIVERREATVHLQQFVNDLAGALDARPDRARWAEHVEWLIDLLTTYVADATPIEGPIRELRDLDALAGPTDAIGFAAAVVSLLEGLRDRDVLASREGAFGLRGVNVLDVNSLRHLGFRAVAIAGLSERSFPPPPREDPLLLDDRRLQLNAEHGFELATRVRERDPDPLQFHTAVAAARERLLVSYPRIAADGRGSLPSSFLRAVAQAVSGTRTTVQDIELGHAPCLERLRSGRLGPPRADDALTATERRRTQLEDGLAGAVQLVRHRLPRTAAGALARDARDDRALTAYDGRLSEGAVEVLATLPRFARALSATALETYAACPHQHFLKSVLGLRQIEDPEAITRLSVLEKGSAVHEILERFMRERPAGAESYEDEARRLRAVADPILDALEADGRTGYPLLWRADRTQILEDLDRWLKLSLEREAARPGHRHHGYEVGFGPDWHHDPAVTPDPLTHDEPLEIALPGGGTVPVAGKVDRVDHGGPRGSFEVVDYKTGSMWGKKTDKLGGGELLQLPIYVLAVARALGLSPNVGRARYASVDRRGDFREVDFDGALLDGPDAPFFELLEDLVVSRASGDFHRRPEPKKCEFCDVRGACEPRRAALAKRKGKDPLVLHGDERKERWP